jgi:tetratricopeptide (TPR) repeat protein
MRVRRRSRIALSFAISLPAWFAVLATGAQERNPIFTRDVAPILFDRCVSCHRPGGDAPFSLVTFEDVRARAQLIARVTRQRSMPPWKATSGGPFIEDRSLTGAQIDTLERWVATGATRGSDADAPQAPPPLTEWRLGPPDLIVTLPAPYALGADGPDEFRNFALPVPIDVLTYVAAVEVSMNGTRAVHHANLRIDPTDWSRRLDAEDPRPGYEGAVSPNARYPDGHFLGWTPGQTPTRAARGMAWRLRPGTDLVMQLHLKSTGKPELVQPRVAFYFTADPPDRAPLALRLGRQNLDIAPDTTYIARDSYTLPVDIELHAIHPHAHSRATAVSASALLPDGSERTLLHIADWDFDWQDVYRYRDPVSLPRGSTITTEFTYDNSTRNRRTPDSPARRVLFGQNSSDEMGDMWLQVVTKTAGDRARLYQDIYPKTVAEDVAGYEMVLRGNPNHAGYRRDLANGYYNLGTLHLTRDRFTEAAAAFQSALTIRPDHSSTHNNLGVALKALKQLDAAIQHFERAIALDPTNTSARQNLAAAVALKK